MLSKKLGEKLRIYLKCELNEEYHDAIDFFQNIKKVPFWKIQLNNFLKWLPEAIISGGLGLIILYVFSLMAVAGAVLYFLGLSYLAITVSALTVNGLSRLTGKRKVFNFPMFGTFAWSFIFIKASFIEVYYFNLTFVVIVGIYIFHWILKKLHPWLETKLLGEFWEVDHFQKWKPYIKDIVANDVVIQSHERGKLFNQEQLNGFVTRQCKMIQVHLKYTNVALSKESFDHDWIPRKASDFREIDERALAPFFTAKNEGGGKKIVDED